MRKREERKKEKEEENEEEGKRDRRVHKYVGLLLGYVWHPPLFIHEELQVWDL